MRWCCLLLTLILASCSNDPDAPVSQGREAADSAAVDAPTAPLRFADLAAVCDGQGESRTAAYSRDPSAPPRLLVLVRDSTGAGYGSRTSDVYFRDWGVYGSGSLPETEVVACLTGFPDAFVETCEFTNSRSDSTDAPYYLDLYGASYNVRLRAARTGELLDEFGLDATFVTCPLLHSFVGDDRRDRGQLGPPMQELKDQVLARLAPDYDTRREFMDDDQIRESDSLRALRDSLRRR